MLLSKRARYLIVCPSCRHVEVAEACPSSALDSHQLAANPPTAATPLAADPRRTLRSTSAPIPKRRPFINEVTQLCGLHRLHRFVISICGCLVDHCRVCLVPCPPPLTHTTANKPLVNRPI
uniref:Uncharacterized protein n=1 Tax=Plectus sambesii TaxID=2011161 RepID=A0A914WWG1_9BILA